MILKWDYQKLTCGITMPEYVTNVLNESQYSKRKHPHHTLAKYVTSVYRTKKTVLQNVTDTSIIHKKIINIKISLPKYYNMLGQLI